MELNPQERADFDEIVTRLRLEDVEVGAVEARPRSLVLLLSVLGSVLVFGLGVILASENPAAFAALMVAALVLGGVGLTWRVCTRSRPAG